MRHHDFSSSEASEPRWEWGRGHRGGPPWLGRGRWLFIRFAFMFGFISVFLLGWMAVIAFLVTRAFGGADETAVVVWLIGLGLLLAFPSMAMITAVRAFRGVAKPAAELMAASDAVARGDLTARVSEPGRGVFSRVARSFNRMADEVERTDQLRRNLTADVAHELRNPLQIILGNLEGFVDGIHEPTPERIHATLDETRLLGRLVDDLGTLSRGDAGQLPLDRQTVDVSDIVADLATSFEAIAQEAGVEIIVASPRVDDDSDAMLIDVDLGRINQALGNLIINAFRHTRSGGRITLTFETIDDGVRLAVKNTGEGIPADDLPYVFDRFWRGDRSRARNGSTGGGLGLPIARQLIEAHGRAISVSSEMGEGTTFFIDLPVADHGSQI